MTNALSTPALTAPAVTPFARPVEPTPEIAPVAPAGAKTEWQQDGTYRTPRNGFEADLAPKSASASSEVKSIRPAYAEFKVDAETQRVSITIVDPETKEVIREIPPEETERISRVLRDYGERLQSIKAGSRPEGVGPSASA